MSALYAGFDTETTGLEPGDHRIIEVYIGLWQPDGSKVFEWESRIDPQRSISVEAQRVHHITSADLAGKPLFAAVAPIIQKALAKATHHVAHNAPFDIQFLESEFKRLGMQLPKRTVIDTMDCTWATHDGKKPSLAELCFACGVDYDTTPGKAHAAPYDVRDTLMPAFFKAREWGFLADIPQLKAA
jgi:DNA polymerase III epsilon subunit-like protein